MNKKVLFVLSLSWFFAGCASQTDQGAPGPSGPLNPPSTLTCESYTPGTCMDKGMNPIVKIDLDAKTIDPECLKVKKNRPIIFKFISTGTIAKNTVEILPKKTENDWWLARKNTTTAKQILVHVPENGRGGKGTFPAEKYEYEVLSPNWCVDPRVDVTN